MMFRSDFFATAYDDYLRALARDPSDAAALDGFARSAIMARRATDALADLKERPAATPAWSIARSKLLAASGAMDAALAAAEQASSMEPVQVAALEQEATLVADAGDAVQLGLVVEQLNRIAPQRAVTHYFGAVSRFLRGDAEGTVKLAEQAVAADPAYAPTYDLLGAAQTKLGQTAAARNAFETSLRLNAHDSTAYTNLGVLELAQGNRAAAAGFFAEALWLDPGVSNRSPGARRGPPFRFVRARSYLINPLSRERAREEPPSQLETLPLLRRARRERADSERERAGVAARERACGGVRGAKPLGMNGREFAVGGGVQPRTHHPDPHFVADYASGSLPFVPLTVPLAEARRLFMTDFSEPSSVRVFGKSLHWLAAGWTVAIWWLWLASLNQSLLRRGVMPDNYGASILVAGLLSALAIEAVAILFVRWTGRAPRPASSAANGALPSGGRPCPMRSCS